ncbi:hypothetical protein LPJ59_000376 [Coemansia sp. RSA 2399]|nr:hypothetical protein LPJ59_000376 [Coemansia sp. RSA 2399]KAJ1908084.1 hypothetical protein LPJ81_000323 [Coemansia sp. IMI 209127]
MDSFQYVYGGSQFAGATPMASIPMQHAGIPSTQQQQQQQQQGVFMQHMDASADQHIQQQLLQQHHQQQQQQQHHHQQQLPMMAQYTHDPFTASRSSPAPQQQMGNTYAPRIINDPESAIFYHDARSNSLVDHSARQMVSADGAVFIEHLAGYSVVFVPNSLPIDSAICDIASALRPSQAGSGGRAGSAGSDGNKRAAAAALRKPHVTKPSNPFIMYRNFKIREMRIQNPAINQTDISREAGKWWKEETDEVKEMFRAKYREEKQAYDVLKSKRARGNTEAAKLGGLPGSEEGDDMYGPATKKRKMSAGLGLSDRPSSAIAKPRSRTMPSNAYGASNARLSVATDLRKHLAAKHHYESSGNAFIDGSSPFDHHQHHEFHNPYAGMSAATVNNSPMTTIADPYVDGAMPPISLGAVQVFQSVSMPQHPADYQDHTAYLYQQQENPLVSMPSMMHSTSLAPEGYANIAAVAADMGISSSSVVAAAAAAASVVAVGASAATIPEVPPIVTTSDEHHQHWGALSEYVDPSASASADNAPSPDDALDNSALTTVGSSGGYSPHNDKEVTYKLPSIAELSGSTPADTSSAEAVTASEISTSAAATAV